MKIKTYKLCVTSVFGRVTYRKLSLSALRRYVAYFMVQGVELSWEKEQ